MDGYTSATVESNIHWRLSKNPLILERPRNTKKCFCDIAHTSVLRFYVTLHQNAHTHVSSGNNWTLGVTKFAFFGYFVQLHIMINIMYMKWTCVCVLTKNGLFSTISTRNNNILKNHLHRYDVFQWPVFNVWHRSFAILFGKYASVRSRQLSKL